MWGYVWVVYHTLYLLVSIRNRPDVLGVYSRPRVGPRNAFRILIVVWIAFGRVFVQCACG